MKTDFYTKTLLTVIAICLTLIVFKSYEFIPTVQAGDVVQPMSVPTGFAFVPVNADGTIDVHIRSASGTIDVDLVDISTTDELEVDIEEVGGYSVYGAIPVKTP